jgi:Family of unknown function (DUF5367)
MRRALRYGLVLWLAGTVAIRFGGYRLLDADAPYRALLLYAASFAAMAWVVPRIFRALGLEKDQWFAAVTLLMLPTLVLDPLSCVFFTRLFPGADPSAAGIFGGWMLSFCGGAVAGVWVRR